MTIDDAILNAGEKLQETAKEAIRWWTTMNKE
jgi:hypothetical protein